MILLSWEYQTSLWQFISSPNQDYKRILLAWNSLLACYHMLISLWTMILVAMVSSDCHSILYIYFFSCCFTLLFIVCFWCRVYNVCYKCSFGTCILRIKCIYDVLCSPSIWVFAEDLYCSKLECLEYQLLFQNSTDFWISQDKRGFSFFWDMILRDTKFDIKKEYVHQFLKG